MQYDHGLVQAPSIMEAIAFCIDNHRLSLSLDRELAQSSETVLLIFLTSIVLLDFREVKVEKAFMFH